MKKYIALLTTVLMFVTANVFAQGVPVKAGSTSNLWEINSNKAGLVVEGVPTNPSYTASVSGLATTALYSMQLEAPAANRMRITQICVGVSNATAAVAVTVTVQRRTTASTGGTLCTAEGTSANCAVSKNDPADANFGGVARSTPTLGTAGAILDQWGFQVGELGAGTADPISQPFVCQRYGERGMKPITVSAGTANGLSVSVTAPGAGGLASGAISMDFYTE